MIHMVNYSQVDEVRGGLFLQSLVAHSCDIRNGRIAGLRHANGIAWLRFFCLRIFSTICNDRIFQGFGVIDGKGSVAVFQDAIGRALAGGFFDQQAVGSQLKNVAVIRDWTAPMYFSPPRAAGDLFGSPQNPVFRSIPDPES